MLLSIVATLYQSAGSIDEFHQRVSQAATDLVGEDYEIIYVNDGSPDDSDEKVMQLANADPHIVFVDLSRNFGHHKAIMTGLKFAEGDKVFLIDTDLEEEPEWLDVFNSEMLSSQSDVIYGVQNDRKGGYFERVSGELFYRLLVRLSGMSIPKNMVTARLMTQRYVQALLQHKETEVFLAGLFHITGFEQKPYVVQKLSLSPTTYTFKKKMTLLVNSITAFSTAPLTAIFYFGMSVSLLSCLYSLFLIIRWLFFSNTVSGWTSVMVSIWLLAGLIISFIGVVGIYVSRIFSETKRRPYTIIKNVVRNEDSHKV